MYRSVGKGCVGWISYVHDVGWLYCGAWCHALEYLIFFSMEGSLGWVIFNFDNIKSKYVGCDCIWRLGVICKRSRFVDSYYGGVWTF